MEEKHQKSIEDLQSRLKSVRISIDKRHNLFMFYLQAQQRTDEADNEVGKLQLKVDKLKGIVFHFSIRFFFIDFIRRKIG
jgi:hypothetical protein